MFNGSIVALTTPFSNNSIDEAALVQSEEMEVVNQEC